MGCWADTDFITQLPIEYKDKIRAFIIVNHSDEDNSSCHSDDFWAPLGLAIKGEYNDYGNIENFEENLYTEMTLNKLKSGWVPFKEKYEKVSLINDMPLSEALYWIERGYAKFNLNGKASKLGLVFVLEDIYQTMISFDDVATNHYVTGKYKYEPISKILESQFNSWFFNTKEILDSLNSSPELNLFKLEIYENRDFFYCDHKDYIIREYRQLIIDYIKKNVSIDDLKVKSIYQSLKDFFIFKRFMYFARKSWSPQTGKGSQESGLAIYKSLNNSMANIIKNKEKEMKKEGHDFPDKNGYIPFMLEHNKKI